MEKKTTDQVRIERLERQVHELKERLRRSIEPQYIELQIPIMAEPGDELIIFNGICLGVNTGKQKPLAISGPSGEGSEENKPPKKQSKIHRGSKKNTTRKPGNLMADDFAAIGKAMVKYPNGCRAYELAQACNIPRGSIDYRVKVLCDRGALEKVYSSDSDNPGVWIKLINADKLAA